MQPKPNNATGDGCRQDQARHQSPGRSAASRNAARRGAAHEKVEFRWRQHEEPFAGQLADSAREAGRPIGDHARELLKSALNRSDGLEYALDALRQEVAALRQQVVQTQIPKEALQAIHENIYQLRDNLATAVVKLLLDAGQCSEEDAHWWVREALDAQ